MTTAAAQPSIVDAPIASVTVFPNQARITRRGSVEFKREVARVLTARALRRALQRARGEQ